MAREAPAQPPPSREPYPADKPRGADIELRHPWQRWVFIGGLVGNRRAFGHSLPGQGSVTRHTPLGLPAFPTAAGIFFGLGLGGFLGGIVLHQIFLWHHVLSG